MIYIILILSFLLDGILFSLFSFNTPISPLFSLLSILIIYPYCDTNKKSYFICPALLGVLYDIAYSNSLFLNTLLFLGFSYLIIKIFQSFTINIINVLIVGLIGIVLYRFSVSLFMHIIGVTSFDTVILFASVYRSIIVNVIYIMIFYSITTLVASKLKVKKHN